MHEPLCDTLFKTRVSLAQSWATVSIAICFCPNGVCACNEEILWNRVCVCVCFIQLAGADLMWKECKGERWNLMFARCVIRETPGENTFGEMNLCVFIPFEDGEAVALKMFYFCFDKKSVHPFESMTNGFRWKSNSFGSFPISSMSNWSCVIIGKILNNFIYGNDDELLLWAYKRLPRYFLQMKSI